MRHVRRRVLGCSVFVLLIVTAVGAAGSVARAQQRGGRVSPPQPQQQQGIEYFAGSWNMVWTGRESALTAGPRAGGATFTPQSDGHSLQMRAEGTIEDSGPFRESGTLDWNAARKLMTFREKVADGIEVTGAGDWSSPIGIRYESLPVQVKGETLRIRRMYSIISKTSFQVTEELSTNGGPFVRLGNGDFRRKE